MLGPARFHVSSIELATNPWFGQRAQHAPNLRASLSSVIGQAGYTHCEKCDAQREKCGWVNCAPALLATGILLRAAQRNEPAACISLAESPCAPGLCALRLLAAQASGHFAAAGAAIKP